MKKHAIINFIAVMSLIFALTGCQSSQAQIVNEEVKPTTKTETPQQEQPKTAEPTEAATISPLPKLVMIKANHDFGKIGPSSVHKANYEFKNEGEGVLSVNRVQTTCGCSKPTLIKDGKRYAMPMKNPVLFESGESGQVEVTYTASSAKGKAAKHLYILSNDSAMPRAQLELKAEVVVKMSIEPEKVDLRLDAENAGMPDILIKSTDGQEFSITSVYAAEKAIKVPFDPEAKAAEFTLKPEVDLEQLGLSKTGVIQIKTTHPQAGTMLVRYNVKPMYELTNPRYILQNIEPGKPIIRENLIRSNYGKPVEIESTKSRNGYMEILKQEPDGDHIKLTVKITPPDRESNSRRYVTDELAIVLKDGQKLTIRCSGWFRLK